MAFYNQAIARTSTYRAANPKSPDYAFLAEVNLARANKFDYYCDGEGQEPDVIARALNRLFTKDAWKNGTTCELLMFGIFDRLGFGPNCDRNCWANEKAQFVFKGVVFGLYNGVSETMDETRIVN